MPVLDSYLGDGLVVIDAGQDPGFVTPWWDVYQPVDYNLTSRMGNEAQFKTMVKTCRKAGVKVEDDAQALFSQIFLSSKGDDLPPVDALAMFYEFRDLTPIGRRGDEMIRRLADRLVAVDLLGQASEAAML